MSALMISDLSDDQRKAMFPNVVAMPTGNCVIRDEVSAYCEAKGLGEVQIRTCIESAVLAHSVEAGKKTADRLVEKNRVRVYRHNHFHLPEPA